MGPDLPRLDETDDNAQSAEMPARPPDEAGAGERPRWRTGSTTGEIDNYPEVSGKPGVDTPESGQWRSGLKACGLTLGTFQRSGENIASKKTFSTSFIPALSMERLTTATKSVPAGNFVYCRRNTSRRRRLARFRETAFPARFEAIIPNRVRDSPLGRM